MVREELSMRNPLNKRLPRELKHDFGKYLVIFLFMVMMISLVSGFLVADNSVSTHMMRALKNIILKMDILH